MLKIKNWFISTFQHNPNPNETNTIKIDKKITNLKLVKFDTVAQQRGVVTGKYDCIILGASIIIGYNNMWTFPFHVLSNGGLTFIFLYIIFNIVMALPLLILELGIGQFTSFSPIKCLKVIPLFCGIGYSQLIISIFILIFLTVILTWICYYIFIIISGYNLYLYCNNSYNNYPCNNLTIFFNNSTEPTVQYFIYYIKDAPNVEQNVIKIHLLIPLLIIISLTITITLFKIKHMIKLFTIILIMNFLLFIIFIIWNSTLPGALNGLNLFLKFNLTILYYPDIYLHTIFQVVFSMSLACGALITLGSINGFYNNFYYDSINILILNFVYCMLMTISYFLFLGHYTYKNNDIFDIENFTYTIYFTLYLKIISLLPGSYFWLFLLYFIQFLSIINGIIILFYMILINVGDIFNIIRKSILYKIITNILFGILYILLCLFFLTPNGSKWLIYIFITLLQCILPVLGFLECIIIDILYGFLSFQEDIKMMLGYKINTFWLLFSAVVTPFCMALCFISNIYTLYVKYSLTPLWVDLIIYIIIILITLPILLGIFLITNCFTVDTNMSYILKYLMTPPLYYGPYYKTNWLENYDYTQKMLRFCKYQIFTNHVPEIEDFDEIIKSAEQSQNQLVNFPVSLWKSFTRSRTITMDSSYQNS